MLINEWFPVGLDFLRFVYGKCNGIIQRFHSVYVYHCQNICELYKHAFNRVNYETIESLVLFFFWQ